MNSSDTPDQSVVDFNRALTRVAGDESMLRELAQIFLQESPNWLDQLEEAINEGEANGAFRAAHDIKGSTEVFCAESAAQAAKTIERMGRQGELEGADEALGALKAELVWVRNALEQYLEAGQG